MRAVTGIELGVDSCVMARVRPGRKTVRVSALHGLYEGDWNPDQSLSENLREARRSKGFPRRAHVIAWGIHEGASATDPSAKATLAPVWAAGFAVAAVMSPPEALALLAQQRPRATGREGAVWLSVNRHGAGIAVVHGGELWYSRVFNWDYRPTTTMKEELLQRYSLVAHLAPELRHAIDVVRAERGVRIDAVVTCGDLPDLRSLTMPLIEELDIEVETLDTLEGLEVVAPAKVEAVVEKAPAMRLACAAALTKGAGRTSFSRAWMGAASVVLIAALVWAASRYFAASVADDRRASTLPAPVVDASRRPQPPPADTTVDRPPATQSAARGGRSREVVASDRPTPDVNVPAATTGRQDPSAGHRAGSLAATEMPASLPERPRVRPAPVQTSRGMAAARSAPVPLTAPLPVVNSILVAPDRRLAVVDGEIVREGERVGPRVLIRIEPGALLLREPSGYEVRVPIRRTFGPEAERDPGV